MFHLNQDAVEERLIWSIKISSCLKIRPSVQNCPVVEVNSCKESLKLFSTLNFNTSGKFRLVLSWMSHPSLELLQRLFWDSQGYKEILSRYMPRALWEVWALWYSRAMYRERPNWCKLCLYQVLPFSLETYSELDWSFVSRAERHGRGSSKGAGRRGWVLLTFL